MASEPGHPGQQAYDRWFLLGEKRNELLTFVEPGSLAEVTARFPWSARKVYNIAPGHNPGLLLATWGWAVT
jgi:hypothetical protein